MPRRTTSCSTGLRFLLAPARSNPFQLSIQSELQASEEDRLSRRRTLRRSERPCYRERVIRENRLASRSFGEAGRLSRKFGEGGIRTLDTDLTPYNRLATCRFRPLSHLSISEGAHVAPSFGKAERDFPSRSLRSLNKYIILSTILNA